MVPNVTFALINIVSALSIIGVSIPLVKGKIRKNHFYGVRIKKSMASDESWYKINAYGGKQLILWSIPLAAAGFVCFFIPFEIHNRDLLVWVLGVAPITICITMSVKKIYAYANKL